LTVPELAVDPSVNAIAGQAELFDVNAAVQVIQVMLTVFETVAVQPVVVVMVNETE